MIDTLSNKPKEDKDEPKKSDNIYVVSDVRADDVVLKLDDGRVFIAKLKDGPRPEGLRRNARVAISSDDLDKDGVPVDAVITRVVPAS